MTKRRAFDLDTKVIGALPLVNHFLDRLRFEHFLSHHLAAPDPRATLAPLKALGVLVRNLVVARVPIYGVEEWVTDRVPALLHIASEEVVRLNDDRIGRALDHLFDADRRALLTELVVHMAQEFEVSFEQLHNDSTTLTLHGERRHR